jgi:competence protein ComEC
MPSRTRPWALLGVALVLCCSTIFACVVATSAPAATQAILRVDFLDVGHGDAALITSPTSKHVLIDGGPAEASQRVVAFLQERRACPLDLVLLTHRHADHLGGLAAIIRLCGTRMYLDAPDAPGSAIYGRLVKVLESEKVAVRQAERGRAIDLGRGARLVLLGPPVPPITGAQSDANANSVVSRLDYGGTRVLFMGDADVRAEAWLMGSGANLRATVLKVAHHGSRYASTSDFLRAVSPLAAIVSTAAGDAKHPHPETLARIGQVGAQVFRTDLNGSIALETDGANVTVHGRGQSHTWKVP